MGLQGIAVAAVALPMWLVGAAQAGSAVLGGLVVVLPNAYFAVGAVRRKVPDGDAERLTEARRLLGRGIAKWALAVLLMVAVFRLVAVEPLGFFGALDGRPGRRGRGAARHRPGIDERTTAGTRRKRDKAAGSASNGQRGEGTWLKALANTFSIT